VQTGRKKGSRPASGKKKKTKQRESPHLEKRTLVADKKDLSGPSRGRIVVVPREYKGGGKTDQARIIIGKNSAGAPGRTVVG